MNEERLVNQLKSANAKIAGQRKAIRQKDSEIERLRAALKKIDDLEDGDFCKFFAKSDHCRACKYLETCSTGIAHSALAEGGAK